MNITIILDTKQQRAFDKRITGGATAESLAQQIVLDQAQAWAESDYLVTSNQLVEALKDKPQEVLDGIIDQLSNI